MPIGIYGADYAFIVPENENYSLKIFLNQEI